MEILGIGAPELLFVIIIALIVLGPRDMQKAGRTIGRWLNQLVRSDGWKAFQQTSRELRNLPNNLMREANMELAEMERELRKATDFRSISPASSPSRGLNQPQGAENSTQSELPPSAPLKTQSEAQPITEDSAGSSENEHSIQPPVANPPEPQADGNPDAEDDSGNKTAGGESVVSTKDQDA